MSSNHDFITWFEAISLQDRLTVGGKGASLGELSAAGIRVPPGFVVTTAAFREFIKDSVVGGEIIHQLAALQADALEDIAAVTRGIRDKIATMPLPEAVQDAIIAAYRSLCSNGENNYPVAVRSSATSEDGEDASFAGLQDTLLWICSEADALAAVKTCWASLYSPESVGYRLRLQLPEEEIAMAIVVQRMVNSRSSGVMFTRSPATGDRSVIAIECSWGLGSSIVSGDVTPDKFIVSKVTGEISSRSIAGKTIQHLPDLQNSGILVSEVPAGQQTAASISDAELQELVKIGKQVEQHYGSPQDIEWAITGSEPFPENIYLLQSRPETVWAGKDKEKKPVATPKARAYDHVFSALGGKK
jgi:pyruvate,water dikinase